MDIYVLLELKLCLFYWNLIQLFKPIFDLFAAGKNKVPFTSTANFLVEQSPQPIAEQVTTLTKTFNNLELWNNLTYSLLVFPIFMF